MASVDLIDLMNESEVNTLKIDEYSSLKLSRLQLQDLRNFADPERLNMQTPDLQEESCGNSELRRIVSEG